MGTPDITIAALCAGVVIFFALLFGTLLLMRWFRHKERMAMIEQGLMPVDAVEAVKPRNGKATLAWGIGITALGLAVLCATLWLGVARVGSTGSIAPVGPLMLPGLFILFMGIALITIHFATRPAPETETPAEESLLSSEFGDTPELPDTDSEEVEAPPE